MKLLVRGGSIPAGHGVARSYVDILRDYYSPRGLDIITRSRFGETSFSGVDSFREDIAPHCPEILLLHFGVDDAFSAVYRSEFKENLVRVIRMARQHFEPVIFLATSHTFDNSHDMDTVNIFYRATREVSEDLHCRMIPVHTFWAGYLSEKGLKNSGLVQRDVRYPNEKGHEIIAAAMIPTLDGFFAVTPQKEKPSRRHPPSGPKDAP